MYRFIKTKKYLYTIEIKLNAYKFTLFPMVYIALLSNNGFKIEIGIGTLIAEFSKVRRFNKEKIREMIMGFLDSAENKINRKEL